jgi:Flp pilus assembly protein TadD
MSHEARAGLGVALGRLDAHGGDLGIFGVHFAGIAADDLDEDVVEAELFHLGDDDAATLAADVHGDAVLARHQECAALLDEAGRGLEDFLKHVALHGRDRPRVRRLRQGAASLGLLVCVSGCVSGEARAGFRALDARDFAGAAHHLDRAAEARPRDVRVQLARGQAHLAAGHADAAIRALGAAAALAPRDPEPLILLGHAHELGHDYDAADAAYVEACARAPTRAQPLRVLGARRLRWREPARAVDPLRRALALEPARPDTHNALGMALAKAGDLVGAERVFRDALAAFPGEQPLWLGLGVVLVERGELGAALAHYGALAERWPSFAAAHVAQGELLVTLGRRTDALAAFDRAIALAPGRTSFTVRRAAIAAEQGRAPVTAE